MIDQSGHLFDPTNPRNAAHPYTGPISTESGFKINPNGQLGYFDKDASNLSVPLERYSLFAATNYNFNEHITMFTEARFTENNSVAFGTHVGLFNIWAIQVPVTTRGMTTRHLPTFGQGPTGFAHHPVPARLAALLNVTHHRESHDITAGNTKAAWTAARLHHRNHQQRLSADHRSARGPAVRADWTWEIYGSTARPRRTHTARELSQPAARRASCSTPIITASTGATPRPSRSRVGVPAAYRSSTRTAGVNNTPTVSQDCADYVTLRMNNVTSIAQDIIEANVQGSLFNIWGGPLQFAAGADYRSERYSFTPDAAPTTPIRSSRTS